MNLRPIRQLRSDGEVHMTDFEARKKEWLGHISHALGRKDVPKEVAPYSYEKGPQQHMMRDMTMEEIVDRFKKECDLVGTRYVEATEQNLAEVILNVVRENGSGKVICATDPALYEYGIDKILANKEDENIHYTTWDAEQGREVNIANAQDASIGITFPSIAIAATATIVQGSYKESGRSVGLLPITHIAVVRKSSIVPRMTQSMAYLSKWYHEHRDTFPTNICHISGPSNTADIELVRVVGVHGPIHVTFVLLDDVA